MQFQVPQFIEQEDHIFGPLTFKQFLYVVGGGGAIFVFYSLLPFYIALFFIIPIGVLSALLAFKPVNNRPFEVLLEAAFRFILKDKLYLWRKEKRPLKDAEDLQETFIKSTPREFSAESKKEGSSHLDDLSWKLEVGETKKENHA
jgi:hypothetical protein